MSHEDRDLQSHLLNRRVSRRDVLKGAALVVIGGTVVPVLAGCNDSTTTTTAGDGAPTTAGVSATTTTAGGGSAAKSGGELRVAVGAGSAKEDLNVHAPGLTPPSELRS